MDPTATWKELTSALRDNNFEEAKYHADNLNKWLITGGFVPKLSPEEIRALLIVFLLKVEKDL